MFTEPPAFTLMDEAQGGGRQSRIPVQPLLLCGLPAPLLPPNQ